MNEYVIDAMATLRSLNPQMGERNFSILCERAEAYARRTDPQVGDFVKMRDGTLRRFTHDWGDRIQTTCPQFIGTDRFYLNTEGVSFSGALDSAMSKSRLRSTGATRVGRFWLFRYNLHNDVLVSFPCRIWRALP